MWVLSAHVSLTHALWLSQGVSSAGPQQPIAHCSTPLQ
jgi:hypothetical protein